MAEVHDGSKIAEIIIRNSGPDCDQVRAILTVDDKFLTFCEDRHNNRVIGSFNQRQAYAPQFPQKFRRRSRNHPTPPTHRAGRLCRFGRGR